MIQTLVVAWLLLLVLILGSAIFALPGGAQLDMTLVSSVTLGVTGVVVLLVLVLASANHAHDVQGDNNWSRRALTVSEQTTQDLHRRPLFRHVDEHVRGRSVDGGIGGGGDGGGDGDGGDG